MLAFSAGTVRGQIPDGEVFSQPSAREISQTGARLTGESRGLTRTWIAVLRNGQQDNLGEIGRDGALEVSVTGLNCGVEYGYFLAGEAGGRGVRGPIHRFKTAACRTLANPPAIPITPEMLLGTNPPSMPIPEEVIGAADFAETKQVPFPGVAPQDVSGAADSVAKQPTVEATKPRDHSSQSAQMVSLAREITNSSVTVEGQVPDAALEKFIALNIGNDVERYAEPGGGKIQHQFNWLMCDTTYSFVIGYSLGGQNLKASKGILTTDPCLPLEIQALPPGDSFGGNVTPRRDSFRVETQPPAITGNTAILRGTLYGQAARVFFKFDRGLGVEEIGFQQVNRGEFSFRVDGLQQNAGYCVRAFAQNESGERTWGRQLPVNLGQQAICADGNHLQATPLDSGRVAIFASDSVAKTTDTFNLEVAFRLVAWFLAPLLLCGFAAIAWILWPNLIWLRGRMRDGHKIRWIANVWTQLRYNFRIVKMEGLDFSIRDNNELVVNVASRSLWTGTFCIRVQVLDSYNSEVYYESSIADLRTQSFELSRWQKKPIKISGLKLDWNAHDMPVRVLVSLESPPVSYSHAPTHWAHLFDQTAIEAVVKTRCLSDTWKEMPISGEVFELLKQQNITVINPVGQGGQSQTFLAVRHRHSDIQKQIKQRVERVFVKLLPDDALQTEEKIYKCGSNGLMKFYGSARGAREKLGALLLEWFDGKNLYSLDRNAQAWPLEALARALINQLKSVRAMLGPGIVHGDLHPGNVLVAGGELRIVDWSSARTTSHSTTVKPAAKRFESPEHGLRVLDSRSDVFQVGLILAYLHSVDGYDQFRSELLEAIMLDGISGASSVSKRHFNAAVSWHNFYYPLNERASVESALHTQ